MASNGGAEAPPFRIRREKAGLVLLRKEGLSGAWGGYPRFGRNPKLKRHMEGYGQWVNRTLVPSEWAPLCH